MHLGEKTKELLTNYFPTYKTRTKQLQAIKETERYFNQLKRKESLANPTETGDFYSLITKKSPAFKADVPVAIGASRFLVPWWFQLLKSEIKQYKLQQKTYSIESFGAIGDGVTDSTKAFRKALKKGNRKIIIPPGTYLTREVRLPSNTTLIGSGVDQTIIKLHPNAPIGERVVRNKNRLRGNHHLVIKNMTLDWNVERLGNTEMTAKGGTASSCLTFAHVTYGVIQTIKTLNAGLHGIDLTAAYYSYRGDGTRSRLGSKYIWADEIEAVGFGDDGITTHHSDYLLISNSYLHHPSGKAHQKGFSNSNGIEIDDGSSHVILVNNRTQACFGGIEIKAHEDSSAANDVQIIGHYSSFDNRSYNFRHIGHHQGEDSPSKTAKGIRGTFLVSIEPQFTPLYQESSPRNLVISAYQGVVINHFVGTTQHSSLEKRVGIAVQYRARDVLIAHHVLMGYQTKDTPLYIGKGIQSVTIKKDN
ncbi:glycosyl hydrolase family 28-related protein [Carnobacterium divergens]|uniref:Rhamnogalacturonase A/B/Epimerase-like pectate lyase domain-containing protein n=1 Tax=Carnobacterium divergens TaxID=2748 RepID=A0A7Z8CYV5_CARDV|nr:glycosyl hydrolase family 28-related protein [Carnobacterium divergens]TFI73500.1 hypothetical protein CKN58_05870 [Carnobacterium divergens]TFI77447.1 hypothetical protein CKN85_05865 [Carnobacterium divergens]TFI84211.1 hypothetical protein CKN56_05905 [Carnobacterium divergens]TFI96057.1 hypothetical protein CKN64_05845 [Carnobacterium divergens]TFJ12360.1 hypothetical protein CKN60_05910 [Carnobacterium divergens]